VLDCGQPFTQRHGDRFRPFERRHVTRPVDLNSVACGILRRMVCSCEIGDHVSSLPLSKRVGTPIVGNTDSASGRFNSALI
jgi:hypothetical protein